METAASVRNYKKRVIRRLGDIILFHSARTSSIWGLLIKDTGKAVELMFVQLMQSICVISAWPFISVNSCKPGVNTCGLGITAIGASYIAVFNHPDIWTVFSPIVAFAVPFIIYFKEWGWQEVYEATVVNVHSKSLVIYNAVYILTSLTHCVMAWCGLSKELNKRGTSYIYLLLDHLLSRYIKVGEWFINFLECLAAIGLGICLIYFDLDKYFGIFLITISGSQLMLLLSAKGAELNDRPLLEI